MSLILGLHLISVGIWIGCVAAETVIELDGRKDDASHIKASKLHRGTDLWVEIPSFTAVFITGMLMITEAHLDGLFLVKVVCGLLAIIFNLICVYTVMVRNKYALLEDIAGMNSTTRLMAIGGAGFILTFVSAIVLGIYFLIKGA